MNAKTYFEKTIDGTTYRIYIIDIAGWPMVIRSALDATDGLHGDYTEQINDHVDLIKAAMDMAYDSWNQLARMDHEKRKCVLNCIAWDMVYGRLYADGWRETA